MHRSQRTKIQLCGQLVVELFGRRVDDQLPGRLGVLLAYLAARRVGPVRRDELIDALWPSAPPASPDAALRTLVSRLRHVIGAETLQGRTDLMLALPADAWIDLEAAGEAITLAQSGVARADWKVAWDAAQDALSVSSRGFLTGHDAPWVDEQRRAVEELTNDGLECTAQAGLRLGGSALAAAERAARSLVNRSPFRESGYQLLMEAHAARGNVTQALHVYDALRVLLRDELGTVPGAAIQALHERLLTDGAARPDRDPVREDLATPIEGPGAVLPLQPWLAARPRDALVGRETELLSLRQIFDRARSTGFQLVLLAGEPGIGKTRLAAELAARLHEDGACVPYGHSDEETLIAYQPFVEAVRHYLTRCPLEELRIRTRDGGLELGALVPELRERLPELPEPVRLSLSSRMRRLAFELSEQPPRCWVC